MWLLVANAAASPGIVLPPGEDPRAWTEAAALAGLTVGCGVAPCVRVEVDGDRWTLRVDGQTRMAILTAPTTLTGRVEVAGLAASLATPLVWAGGPAAPPPQTTRTARSETPGGSTATVSVRSGGPRARAPGVEAPPPAPHEAPGPDDVPAVITPAEVASPRDIAAPAELVPPPGAAEVEIVPRPDPGLTSASRVDPDPAYALDEPVADAPDRGPHALFKVAVGASASGRLGYTASGTVGLGLAIPAGRVEVSLGLGGPAPLVSVDPAVSERRVDLLLAVLATPRPWLAAGVVGAMGHRAWADDGEPVGSTWTPALGSEVRLVGRLPVGTGWIGSRGGLDLRPIALTLDGVDVGRLSPWWVRLEVGVAIEPGLR